MRVVAPQPIDGIEISMNAMMVGSKVMASDLVTLSGCLLHVRGMLCTFNKPER
jgi:hypothetical protein